MQDSFKKKEPRQKRGDVCYNKWQSRNRRNKAKPGADTEEQQKVLKEAINEAKENMQKNLAKSLMGSGFGF
jgi:hypothetical protein